jgi:uncharacterized repeat protein (TIGR03803 family)
MIGFGLLLVGGASAQTFTTLLELNSSTNSAGDLPYAGLIISGNTLYGTMSGGGPLKHGTVFAVNLNGGGFTPIYNFTNGSDGNGPVAGLILSGNTLYGTTPGGGTPGGGTVFKVNTSGAGFTVLHSFSPTFLNVITNSDGTGPWAGLVLSGNTLYGTTQYGGTNGYGTVFAVNTDGMGFTNLHNFAGSGNSDGANPQAGLIIAGNTLYGTTQYGGISSYGTVFALNTNGTSYTNLHSFTSTDRTSYPQAGLVLAGNNLYGTASASVFTLNTNGSGFTNIYTFTSTYEYTNSDGSSPGAALILSGHTLYGTTENGGIGEEGTVFAVNTNGTGFMTLHSFTAEVYNPLTTYTNSDGAASSAGLVLAGNTLYGTALHGGSYGDGTVFTLSLPSPPGVGVARAGNKVVLSWPTNIASVALQTITNLSSGSWSNVTVGINIVGTNYVYTNSMNTKAGFFRLTPSQ